MTTRQRHWDGVYDSRAAENVTWHEPIPRKSLELVELAAPDRNSAILDVGGGASTLPDHLHRAGYQDITVLDVSPKGLAHARRRMGAAAGGIHWVEADVLDFEPDRRYDLWHDRAVLHFLTDEDDRKRYLRVLDSTVRPSGHVVIATFGPQGPETCSGLPVERYGAERIAGTLGSRFTPVRQDIVEHTAPDGRVQQFLYSLFSVGSPSR